MTPSVFTTKKFRLEYLEELYGILDDRERNLNQVWKKTGEQEQAWDYTNSCPKVDNDGNPVMRDRYDYFPKEEEDYSEDDKCRLDVIRELKKSLEKLM